MIRPFLRMLPVAQPDRAIAFYAIVRVFESLRAGHRTAQGVAPSGHKASRLASVLFHQLHAGYHHALVCGLLHVVVG